MTAAPRNRSLGKLLALAAVIAVVGAFQLFGSSAAVGSAAVAQARRDVAEARDLAGKIARLQTRERVASLEVQPPGETIRRVDEALETAGLSARRTLVRVQPQPPVPVDGTDYLLRTTRIELKQAPLDRIARFARALEGPGMTVRQLRLVEPRAAAASGGTGGPELWTADLTLTQTIFAPSNE